MRCFSSSTYRQAPRTRAENASLGLPAACQAVHLRQGLTQHNWRSMQPCQWARMGNVCLWHMRTPACLGRSQAHNLLRQANTSHTSTRARMACVCMGVSDTQGTDAHDTGTHGATVCNARSLTALAALRFLTSCGSGGASTKSDRGVTVHGSPRPTCCMMHVPQIVLCVPPKGLEQVLIHLFGCGFEQHPDRGIHRSPQRCWLCAPGRTRTMSNLGCSQIIFCRGPCLQGVAEWRFAFLRQTQLRQRSLSMRHPRS